MLQPVGHHVSTEIKDKQRVKLLRLKKAPEKPQENSNKTKIKNGLKNKKEKVDLGINQ